MIDTARTSLGNKTKQGLIWSTLLPAMFQIFRFGISIAIARILDPKDFGIMGIASIIIFYADSFTNFGFSTALIQKKRITEAHINSVFTINFIISIFLTLCICLLSQRIAYFFDISELREVFLVMSSVLIITSFYTVPITLLRRNMQFKIISIIDFVKGLSVSVASLILAILGFKVWSLVAGLIAGLILSVILVVIAAKWRPKLAVDWIAVKDIRNFAGWTFISSQLRLFTDYIDHFLIGKFLGPIFLGYYDKSASISKMPVENVSNRVSGVMFSTFSRAQSNEIELRYYLEKSIVTISIICFPLFIGLVLVSDYFVTFLFGAKWVPMIDTLRILLTAYLVHSITNILNTINVSVGKYKEQVIARLLCLSFLIISCMVIIERGIEYVAAALLLYNVLFLFISYKITMSHLALKWHFLLNNVWPAMVSSLLMSMVLYPVIKFFPDKNLTNMCILTLIGMVVYVLCFFVFDIQQTRFLKKDLERMILSCRSIIS